MEDHEIEHDVHGSKGNHYKESHKAVKDIDDRLSNLPDALLLNILGILKMQDVVRTSLLSTRWRYLWTSILCLHFQLDDWKSEPDFVTFIDRSISNHEGSKVQKVHIGFIYKDMYALQVDSWIRFAVRRNVEKLSLCLLDAYIPNDDDWSTIRYKLPHSIFNCKSLVYLALSLCDLNMPATIQLSSLKSLVLEYIDLSDDMIRRLTSNCPLLECLYLVGCNMRSHLHIFIANENLKCLEIDEYQRTSANTEITISAPNLHSLGFRYCLPRAKYYFTNVSSLTKAYFSYFPYQADLNKVHAEHDAHGEIAEILCDLRHVKKLILCRFFVQVLSIRGVQNLDHLSLDTTCLKLETEFTKWELPGVLYLLKSASKIARLVIRFPMFKEEIKLCDDFKTKFPFEEKQFWESQKFDFSSLLQNLKSIKIYFLTGSQPIDNVDEALEKLENKIQFTGFMLKNSKSLEIMTIICCKKSASTNFVLLFKLTEKLMNLPRASCNAEIRFI